MLVVHMYHRIVFNSPMFQISSYYSYKILQFSSGGKKKDLKKDIAFIFKTETNYKWTDDLGDITCDMLTKVLNNKLW